MVQVFHLATVTFIAILVFAFATAARDPACLSPRQQRSIEEAAHEKQPTSVIGTNGVCENHRTARGNSLLQVASKPSKVHFGSSPKTQVPMTRVQESIAVNNSRIQTGGAAAAAESAHGLARTAASFLQAILHAQGSLGVASASGGFYVLLVMTVAFCVLGLLGYLHQHSARHLEDSVDFPPTRQTMTTAQKSPRAPLINMMRPSPFNDARGSAAPSLVESRPSVPVRTHSLLPTPAQTTHSLAPATSVYPPAGASSPRPVPSTPAAVYASHRSNLPLPSTSAPAPAPVAVPPSPAPLDASGVTTKQLCPGLVVPRNSECVLALRALPRDQRKYWSISESGSLRLDILDLAGQPVLRAEVQRPWPVDRAPVVRLASLRPAQGRLGAAEKEEHLAQARAGGNSGQRRSTYIYDCNDVLFGFIKRDVTRPRYVLTSSRGGLNLLFEGDFDNHEVNVLSERREMLAHTEPCAMPSDPEGNYYQVRIAENVDVGLMMSGLLSIDAMET